MPKPNRRLRPEVNAGSMADIAFMLLIFFLVTTTMDVDKGITVMLPPWSETPPLPPPPMNRKNILKINLNAADQLLVRGEISELSQSLNGLRAK